MKKLDATKNGEIGKIVSIQGDTRFLSRVTSIGLTIGSKIEIIKNEKKSPILLYGRDTMIALNRKECTKIMVEVIK